jgi:hypothetical protein
MFGSTCCRGKHDDAVYICQYIHAISSSNKINGVSFSMSTGSV